MKHLKFLIGLGFYLNLVACVGTDIVDDPIIGEKLAIRPRLDSLPIGKEQVFTTQFFNKFGIEETPKNLIWRSSDPTKIAIDANGKATTLKTGKTTLFVSNGTLTDSLVLNSKTIVSSGGTSSDTSFIKQGVFKTINTSYSAVGGVRLQTIQGVTQIVTSADFRTSAGPSLYVLLANHTNGRYTVTPNSQVVNAVSAQITPNRLTNFSGTITWTVPQNVNPADYKYVVLYCTLGPVFGAAELK